MTIANETPIRANVWRLHAAAVVLAMLGVPAMVAAQERSDTTRGDTTARRIQQVTVVGSPTPATIGAASAIVARPDALRTSPAPVLDEALREMPFVLVRQNSRGETEVSVRGSGSRQAAVLLDGVPLTLGWDHRADPSLIPLSGVQTMVLVRGLSSLLHGPNVLGGIIDISLGRAGGSGVPRPRLWVGTSTDLEGGRTLSLGGALPISSHTHGGLTLRAGGGYRQREGLRVTADANDPTAHDGLRTNSDLRHFDGFAALRWQGRRGKYFGLTATGYEAERGVPPELHVQAPRLWRYPHQSRVLATLSAGTGIVATPLGGGSLEITAGHNAGKLAIESYRDRGYTTVDAREVGGERTSTGRLAGTHSLAGAAQLRAVLSGADVRYEERVDNAAPRHYRQLLWSGGAEIQWPLLARTTVGVGAVYDASTTPEAGGREALGRVDAWGWRGGTTVLATDALRLHGSMSRRSRFPALRELYSGALNRFQANPSLKPERLTSVELGATLGSDGAAGGHVARRLALQAVAFHHRLRDAVVQTTVPNTRLFVRVNRDQIRSTGVELLGMWRSSADSIRALSLSGDLLAQRVRVHDDSSNAERRAEHQPEVRGSVEVGIPLPFAARGYAGAGHAGPQYCANPDTGKQLKVQPQTDGNLAVERSWSLGRGDGLYDALRAVLVLNNATDATLYDQCGLPQPGRTLRLMIHVR